MNTEVKARRPRASAATRLLHSRVDTLAISKTEIAKRYRHSRQFIYMALTGQRKMPRPLRRLIVGMIAERHDEVNLAMGRSENPSRATSRKRRAS